MAQEKVPVAIEDEMRKSYLDYAMSVIIGRALPDIRDGLKPVHRRVIYAMHVLGNEYNKPYKKSARVVGDVIGKYHPHGDTAVYDAITRMVQDFSLRYPLIDGQGNFGSIDGDMPAAMRYTEVRMARLASELLKDIEKETVNFIPTYDEQNKEPVVLPASYPNLLVNGSSGIAVGMATNMPPHNLTEIVDALIYIIKNPNAELKDIKKIVKGPDFPTGGFIQGREGIDSAYKTGRGSVKMRGRVTTEQTKGNREAIIITEIPYMVNKAKLIEKVAELVRDKKIEGISDIRDESDRDGMRIVLDLKKDEHAEVIINNLYKQTQLQSSFGIINLAIVDGQPKVLGLMDLLNNFIGFRKEVVTRRTVFDLKKARERAHILEGLKIAVDRMDEVIKLIRSSKSPQLAKEGLIKRFKLSEIQSQAILDMRLHRLTALEQLKIMDEYKEIKKYIKELEAILESEKLLMDIIVKELGEIKERFGDERRTEIVKKAEDISIEELITEEDMVVTITNSGYIKRNPTSLFKIQKRGGKGKTGMTTRDEDFVESLFIASTHSHILFFTDRGKAYALKVYDIPQAGRTAKGKAIVNILNISQGERLTAYLPVMEFEEGKFVVMATQNGTMKKTDLMQFSHIRSGGIIAIGLEDGNNLVSARLTDGKHEIFAATDTGIAIRFHEKDLREMGRSARGVKGINLKKGAKLVGMETISDDATILTVTEKGYGKRTNISDYRSQSRGGSGIINIKVTDKNGPVVGIKVVHETDEAMITTSKGKIIRMNLKDISIIGRSTQGVRLMGKFAEGEKVMGVALIAEKEEA